MKSPASQLVMAGLVPAIHVFAAAIAKDVDARHKAGHDELTTARDLGVTLPYAGTAP
jgi:hypothetical protein